MFTSLGLLLLKCATICLLQLIGLACHIFRDELLWILDPKSTSICRSASLFWDSATAHQASRMSCLLVRRVPTACQLCACSYAASTWLAAWSAVVPLRARIWRSYIRPLQMSLNDSADSYSTFCARRLPKRTGNQYNIFETPLNTWVAVVSWSNNAERYGHCPWRHLDELHRSTFRHASRLELESREYVQFSSRCRVLPYQA